MARSSDVNSTFNVRAASDIAKCDLTRRKYERGLLPSDQTCRRVMQCVYNAAVGIGFSSFPVEEKGNVWCWGDADGRFKNGVNRYVYEVYCKNDPLCEKAPAHDHDPWCIPVTGDGTCVSYRVKLITMCGVKQADARLPSQHETGKTMNQSRHVLTSIGWLYWREIDNAVFRGVSLSVSRNRKKRILCGSQQAVQSIHTLFRCWGFSIRAEVEERLQVNLSKLLFGLLLFVL
jgi:hypothetical protein